MNMESHRYFRSYAAWVKAHDTLADEDRQAIRECVRRLTSLPLFSIMLLPRPDGAISVAHASIDSVRRQLYPHWELWQPQQRQPTYTDTDARFRIIPQSTGPVTDYASLFNSALSVARGEFVLPLPPDAMLAEQALYELAVAIGDDPEAELLYTDEDRLDSGGTRCMPHFKTGWDPDLMLGRDAAGLLVAYRKRLLEGLGGMRLPSALAPYELSLRAGSAAPPVHIRHVPAVLCHRRGSSEASQAWDAEGAREIVRQHLAEAGVVARVVAAPLKPAWNRIVRELPDPLPLVSVIVPTRDRADLLGQCAEGVLSRTDYPAVEFLIVDNGSTEPATFELFQRLSKDPRVRVLSSPGPFNYSALNNKAAREARGEILLLLNNDTDVIGPDWLCEMVSHAVRADVGAVGAKLLYPDGRVQHGGMVLGPGLWPAHQLRLADRLDAGPGGELALVRSVSAVTGACLALRRSVFFEVDGFNEELKIAFGDVDLCLRLGDHGYRIVWTPFAELFHLESASRGQDSESPDTLTLAEEEARYFGYYWKSLVEADPFHNANLVYGWNSLELAEPPRRERRWAA
ncbi:MAG TPA: glycosyltransferase family 2 protein [Steroidobacteraceae bacterium]|nr:glycosyltransferase family 2 protein [Steroidobacteraceae bacterium]